MLRPLIIEISDETELLASELPKDISVIGCPVYTPAQDAGYYIWQDAHDGEWHIRWSGDSVETYHYSGTLSANVRFTEVQAYNYEGNDHLDVFDKIVFFDAYAGKGEDGIDFFVSPGAEITFELTINGVTETEMIHVGHSGSSPGVSPFIFFSLPQLEDINTLGQPEYTPAQDPGYFIWQDIDDREWHLRWSGDSIKNYHYTGKILVNEAFSKINTFKFEGNDEIKISDYSVIFDAYAGAGEDGIDFFVPEGSFLFFELYSANEQPVEIFHIGHGASHSISSPFLLHSWPKIYEQSAIGTPSYAPAQDAGYFVWQDAETGGWHIRWSGDSITTFHYTGFIYSSHPIAEATPFGYEINDQVEIFDCSLRFDAYAGNGEDGLDFSVPSGAHLSFNLLIINHCRIPLSIHIGEDSLHPENSSFALICARLSGGYDLSPTYHSSIGHYEPCEFYVVDVAVDGEGYVYLLDPFRRKVQKRDSQGEAVFEFDLPKSGLYRGITLNEAGDIFLAKHGINRIYRYDSYGNLLAEWGEMSPGVKLNIPTAVAIDKLGRVLVCDRNGISVYDQEGNFKQKIVQSGSGPGEVKRPQDIAVASDNSFYVADADNRRVQKFDQDGNHILEWEVRNPVAIVVSHEGYIIVHSRRQRLEDIGEHQIYKFSLTGELLSSWGAKGHEPGELWEAHGMGLGNDNTLWCITVLMENCLSAGKAPQLNHLVLRL